MIRTPRFSPAALAMRSPRATAVRVKGANIGVALLGARAGRIGGTAFSFLYLVVRALLGALVRSRRGLHVKDVALLAAAACHLPRSSRGMRLVTPQTLLRWHQTLVRRKSRQAPGQRGRPSLSAEVPLTKLRR